MGRCVVPELEDLRMGLESGLHDAALDSASAAMHQSNFGKPGFHRRGDELFDHRSDVPRRKGVEVDLALDRDLECQKKRVPNS